MEVTGRRERRRKQLSDDVKEKEGYFKLKEDALDGTAWISDYVSGCAAVVRQTAE
jgi:hypothetical protein